ncbi:MAG: DUF2785 domain-containing protein [Anaerolineales bacterium]|nr:DUF2785 domain-containing protein [Anaerolineales bacterium]
MPALKQTLKRIAQRAYTADGDAFLLAQEMLDRIGDVDPEMRDELIYAVMVRWILNDVFRPEELLHITHTLLDRDHLTLGLGETESDTVFTRSFSMLLLAPILVQHRKQRLFAREDLLAMFQQVADVFLHEQDLRGYIPGKGWAHAPAHCSDVLDEFALCSELGRIELKHILDIIRKKICISDHYFAFDEDERMVTAAISAISCRELPEMLVRSWLAGFKASSRNDLDQPVQMWQRANIRHFLRALDYRFKQAGILIYQNELSNALKFVSP